MPSRKNKRNANRVLMRLRSQHKYYASTIEDMKLFLSDYEAEWNRDYARIVSFVIADKEHEKVSETSKEFSTVKISIEDETNLQEERESALKESPDWARSLYKKIAKETHPDRVKDEDRKSKMISILKVPHLP